MSVSPVASTQNVATGMDHTASESGCGAAASAFDMLLAGAQSETHHVTDDDESEERDEHSTGATDTDESTPADKPDDLTKSGEAADLGGLLAVLSALAWTPPEPVAPEPAPAESALPPVTATDDGAASAALVDLTAPVDTTALIDLVNDAMASSLSDAAEPPPSMWTTAEPPAPAVDTAPTPTEESAPATSTTPHTGASTATASSAYAETAAVPPVERARPAPGTAPTSTAALAPAPTHTVAPSASVDDGSATRVTTTPPAPAEQLVAVLTPLRGAASGAYTLHLELKPPELGRIELRVEMRDGVLHASIQAEHETSAHLMRNVLGELRDRLSAQGLNPGDLSVSDGAVGSGRREGNHRTASAESSNVTTAAPDEAAANLSTLTPDTGPEATSLLDVRV